MSISKCKTNIGSFVTSKCTLQTDFQLISQGIPQNHTCFCHLPAGIGGIEGKHECMNCHKNVYFSKNTPLIATKKPFNIVSIVIKDKNKEQTYQNERDNGNKRSRHEKKEKKIKTVEITSAAVLDNHVSQNFRETLQKEQKPLCFCPCPYPKNLK